MKKNIIIIILILISILIFCDETTDNKETKLDNLKIRDKAKYFMKFRGSIAFVWDYMFEIQDGIYNGTHISPINYNGIDYTDKGDPKEKHHKKNGRIIGGSWGGTQFELYCDYHFIAPFFTGDNPLIKNNNIKFSLHTQISPITFNSGMSITLTPIAFLSFQSGFLLGFGWNIPKFAAGLGINDDGEIKRLNIGGPHMQLWFSATFQMDIAYLLPKSYQKWTHIIAIATPKIKYQSLMSVDDDQPYMYQECPGEKLSGWWFLGEFFLGYRFYIIEDDIGEDRQFIKMINKNFIITIGMYAWIDYLNLTHFFDSQMKDGWGSDFTYINFGPAMQFDLPNNFFLRLFFFFCNDKAYTNDTVGNADFRDRTYKDWNVYFKWFGLYFGWNF